MRRNWFVSRVIVLRPLDGGPSFRSDIYISLPRSVHAQEVIVECGLTRVQEWHGLSLVAHGKDGLQAMALAFTLLDAAFDKLRAQFEITWASGDVMDNILHPGER